METRPSASENANPLSLPYVDATPKACGGKPRIRGARIRVQDIALWHERLGLSADEIVGRFPQLSLASVAAALTYYYDHREEIQLHIDSADALAQEHAERQSSCLPGKQALPTDGPDQSDSTTRKSIRPPGMLSTAKL